MARILIVDDNLDAREMYRMSLEFEGFDCVEAADGEAGLAQVQAPAPDLILMEANIAGLDGWESAKRITTDPKTRRIPLLMLTAHVFKEHQDRAAAIGVDGFLAKPILPDQVAAEIRRVLKSKSSHKRKHEQG